MTPLLTEAERQIDPLDAPLTASAEQLLMYLGDAGRRELPIFLTALRSSDDRVRNRALVRAVRLAQALQETGTY